MRHQAPGGLSTWLAYAGNDETVLFQGLRQRGAIVFSVAAGLRFKGADSGLCLELAGNECDELRN
jgi:hypothetical protein